MNQRYGGFLKADCNWILKGFYNKSRISDEWTMWFSQGLCIRDFICKNVYNAFLCYWKQYVMLYMWHLCGLHVMYTKHYDIV